jgi:hypothetical protein
MQDVMRARRAKLRCRAALTEVGEEYGGHPSSTPKSCISQDDGFEEIVIISAQTVQVDDYEVNLLACSLQ